MGPLISVIVVTYNRAHYLKDALDSIQRQSFKDYEVILVDDGSIDNSSSICDDYVARFSNFHVIHKNNVVTMGTDLL